MLDFGPQNARGKSRADRLRQTQISFLNVRNPGKLKKTQEQRLRELAIRRLGNNRFLFSPRCTQSLSGSCVRVNSEFYRLVRRLHIIYFRETEYPTEFLLPALLSTFKKRNFTPVTHKRTSQVWGSRKDLLEYERALELDKFLDVVGEEGLSKRETKTATVRRFYTAPPSGSICTPPKTPGSSTNRQSAQPRLEWDSDRFILENIRLDEAIQTTREQVIKMHFDDWVYPGWQELVAIEHDGVRPRPIGLERYDAGESFDGSVMHWNSFSLYRACLHQDDP